MSSVGSAGGSGTGGSAGSSGGIGGGAGSSAGNGASGGIGADSASSASASTGDSDTSVSSATSSETGVSTAPDTAQQTTTDALAASPTSTEALASTPTTSDTLSDNQCAVPDDPTSQQQVDSFHACTSGVTDRAAIDRAQEQTALGGCAALSDEAMLCNPAGPEIGEFTVGRPAGFPDYVGPRAGYDHTYTSRASTPGGWRSLSDELNARIQENPTPGSNQQSATPTGVVNDAGITPFGNTDMVRSSVSTDVYGRQVISNVTIPGQHMLNPGVVSQTAWTDNGNTRAVAVGEGNGWMSIPGNGIAGEVFEVKLESDIRVAITRDTLR